MTDNDKRYKLVDGELVELSQQDIEQIEKDKMEAAEREQAATEQQPEGGA